MELSVLNSFFTFDRKYFKQTDGLGMGLPLCPTFADSCMCYYESIWLSECPVEFRPAFYRRYVDDTFLLFHHKDHWSLFLNYLNTKHCNIKFTMECESNNKLSFLDCLIHKHDNKFECSVYRKNTFTGLGLSYLVIVA